MNWEQKLLGFCIVGLWLVACVEGNRRTKRELRFPKGSSLVAAVALTSFLPKGITQGFAHVLEFDLGFPFPDKMTFNKANDDSKTSSKKIYKKPNRKKIRVKRDLKETHRQTLLSKVENAITRVGLNGSACVSRFLCELHRIPSGNSLLQELLTSLFKTPADLPEGCGSGCPVSFLHAVFHSQHLPPHTLY